MNSSHQITESFREGLKTKSPNLVLDSEIVESINRTCEPFELSHPNLDSLIERLTTKKVVCLGESTHGTEEFYYLRAHVTQRLIRDAGFQIVAFEADFPDMDEVNDYVHGRRQAWNSFHRFPTWMWRNTVFRDFTARIREHNLNEAQGMDVSLYGLDLYSLHSSLDAIYKFFQQRYPEKAKAILEAKLCLEPWQHDPTLYGLSVWNEQISGCEDQVLKVVDEVSNLPSSSLSALLNARALKSAEEYYRAMFAGSVESWNLRDQHMFNTVQVLLDHYGSESKIIIWEHNSHLGNCAATQMALLGEYNVGQLCKEKFGEDCSLVGLYTHSGTVAASDTWGGPMRFKRLNPSRSDSFENLFAQAEKKNFVLSMSADQKLQLNLQKPRLQRAVGVMYLPHSERQSHYFASSLSDQYDEIVWCHQTKALTPLDTFSDSDEPDMYPFGV